MNGELKILLGWPMGKGSTSPNYYYYYHFKGFIYLFLERGVKKKEREQNIDDT